MCGYLHLLTLTLVGSALVTGCKTSGPVDVTSIPKPNGKNLVTGGGGGSTPTGGGSGGLGGGGTLGGGGKVYTTNQPGGATGGSPGGKGGESADYSNPIVDRGALALQTVRFDYDSAGLHPNEVAKVDTVAQYLLQQPTHLLLIEGHCDERGTEQYNMSLGERRAIAIRDRLVQMGVNIDRLKTVSYGEEVPVVVGTTDDQRSQNRRGQFVVVKPGTGPAAP